MRRIDEANRAKPSDQKGFAFALPLTGRKWDKALSFSNWMWDKALSFSNWMWDKGDVANGMERGGGLPCT